MFKNTQFKIILIFFLIGIVIISGLGIVFLNSLDVVSMQIASNGQAVNVNEINNMMQNVENSTKFSLLIAGITFGIIVILIAIYMSRYVIYPINKLIESAEKMTDENQEIKQKSKRRRKKGFRNLDNVFGIMTTELKEKLSEVSTQKNQIETILLHMTDGIIAFNMKGEIILINPAAKKFLSIRTGR